MMDRTKRITGPRDDLPLQPETAAPPHVTALIRTGIEHGAEAVTQILTRVPADQKEKTDVVAVAMTAEEVCARCVGLGLHRIIGADVLLRMQGVTDAAEVRGTVRAALREYTKFGMDLHWVERCLTVRGAELPPLGFFFSRATRRRSLRDPESEKRTDFVVLREIGEGGMGRCFLVLEHGKNEPVVWKCVRQDGPDAAELIAACDEERMVLSGLGELQDAWVDQGERQHFLMRHHRGVTLAALQQELIKGRFHPALAGNIALLIAQTLQKLQQDFGLLHCDVKPGNVVLDPHGVLHLIDYGASRVRDWNASNIPRTPPHTSYPSGIRTPLYSGTEMKESEVYCREGVVYRREGVVYDHSDVYSVAVMLYEMIHGRFEALQYARVDIGAMYTDQNVLLDHLRTLPHWGRFLPVTGTVPGQTTMADALLTRLLEQGMAKPDQRMNLDQLIAGLQELCTEMERLYPDFRTGRHALPITVPDNGREAVLSPALYVEALQPVIAAAGSPAMPAVSS